MSLVINVEDLGKTFAIHETRKGFVGTLKGLLSPHTRSLPAIQNLSFKVRAGERIAFIGPNGAGKSTTIKMLTGILYPTTGQVKVLGHTPWIEREALGYKIGTIFGQRSQLWYHLPPSDTFFLLGKIYDIHPVKLRKTINELAGLFEIERLLSTPVKQLSLGERMRCEIVASLIPQPEILFLDEPTIGLDVNAKLMIRNLLNKISQEQGTTLFLTSHDTADIEKVCDRVIILDKGTKILDCSLKDLKRRTNKRKILHLVTEQEDFSLSLPGMTTLESANYHFACEVDLNITPVDKVIQEALKKTNLKDVTIEDPSMEEIIREIYAKTTS